MLNKKFFLLIILTFLLVHCKPDRKENSSQGKTLTFDLGQEPENIQSTGLIRGAEFIILEDRIPLAEIRKIKKYKDKIYILDKNQQFAVYDTLGEAKYTIFTMGRGPNEYQQLYDFVIDKNKKELNLISRVDKKILIYDLDGEKLLRREKLPRPFTNILKTPKGYLGNMDNYTYEEESPFNVWVLDNNWEEQTGYFEIDKNFESFGLGGRYPFSKHGYKNYFIETFGRTVYGITKDSVYPAFTFDFGKFNMSIKSIKEWDNASETVLANHIFNLNHFQETDDFLIATVSFKFQPYLCIFHKEDKTIQIASLEPYTNEFYFPFGQIISIDQNYIYTAIEPGLLNYVLENEELQEEYGEQFENMQNLLLRRGVNNIEEYNNPILAIYTLN